MRTNKTVLTFLGVAVLRATRRCGNGTRFRIRICVQFMTLKVKYFKPWANILGINQ